MLVDGLLLDSALSEFNRNLIYLLLFFGSIAVGLVIGRRWGEDFSPKVFSLLEERHFTSVALIVALVVGFALRFYSLDFGLPDPYHPDENAKIQILAKMIRTNSLDPGRYLHPPLLLYLAWFNYAVMDWTGFAPDDAVSHLLLAGRSVSMIFGTLSIYLVYLVGEKFSKSKLVGVLAALLIAVAPLHVTCSRYMKEDVLLVFMVLLCVLAALQAANTGKVRYLYLAGFFSGCCFGSKYSGLASVFIVIGTPWISAGPLSLKPNRELLVRVVPALFMFIPGALLTIPILFQGIEMWQSVAHGISRESIHAAKGHHGVVISAWSQLWMFHLSRSISPGIGFVAVFLALAAVGVGLARRDSRILFLVGVIAVFLLPSEFAKSKPPPQFDRYILPCLPFIAILAADFLVSLRFYLQARSQLLKPLALALILIFAPAVQSVAYASEVRNDTRKQMSRWLRENIPRNTKVILSGGIVYFPREVRRYNRGSIRKIVGKDKTQVVELIKSSDYKYLLSTRFGDGNRLETEDDESSRSRIGEGMKRIEDGFPLIARFEPRYGPYGFHNPQISVYKLK